MSSTPPTPPPWPPSAQPPRAPWPPQQPQKRSRMALVLGIVAATAIGLCGLGIIGAAVGGSKASEKLSTAAADLTSTTAVATTAPAPTVPLTAPTTVATTAAPTTAAPVTAAPTTAAPATTLPAARSSSGNETNPPVKDVTITSCTTADFGGMLAKLKVTNHSSETSTYSIQVSFEDAAGNRLDDGYSFVDNLAPGQTATEDATAFKNPPAGKWTCRLNKVDRYAS